MARRKKAKKKAGKKKAARRSKKGAQDNIVVTSKCKAYIKSCGYKSSGDLVDAVNSALHTLLDAAMARAGSNRRSTVRAQDV